MSKVVAYREFPLPKEKKQKSISRLLHVYSIYTHNPSWYNLCHITQRPPLFCNSLRLHFVKTFRAISKINLFPKVSRYVLTLRSRTTSHRYTERQENTCTHAYTTDSTFLCNSCPLWPANGYSLFAKTKEKNCTRHNDSSRLFHIARRVYQHHVTVTETFRSHTAYEVRTDSLHKLIRHILITILKTSACHGQHVPLTSQQARSASNLKRNPTKR